MDHQNRVTVRGCDGPSPLPRLPKNINLRVYLVPIHTKQGQWHGEEVGVNGGISLDFIAAWVRKLLAY